MRMNIDPIIPGSRVLCAVSGGADSMYLLCRMLEIAEERNITVLCAHYNHNQRGMESDRDEAFVRNFCETRNVPFFTERLGSELHSEQKLRAARYDFLRRTAREQACQWILTAHTADDQLETQLLNLARGTGLRGLSGIPPTRGDLLRPMLQITRAEIEAWLRSHEISYVEDSSNHSDDYARNRIRHEAVPALRSVNSAAVRHAAEAAERLREDDAYLNALAEQFLNEQGNSPTAEALRCLPRPIRARVFQALCGGKLSATHMEALHDFCSGSEAASLDMPDIRVTKEQGRLRFGAAPSERLPILELYPDAVVVLSRFGLRVTVSEPMTFQEIHNTLTVYHFKSDAIRGKLTLTSRRPGDKIRLVGRGCTKKISDLLQEQRVPLSKREQVPVLRDDAGPLAVCGFGLAERCAAKPGDLAIRVNIEKMETEHEHS